MKKYVVRDGDTMWSIAEATGVRPKLLLAANPQIRNPNQLKPGSIIVVPELTKSKSNGKGVGTVQPQADPGSGTSAQPASPLMQTTPATATPTVEPTPAQVPTGHSHAGTAPSAPGMPPFFGFVWPHAVQPGETWESIQRQYNVPMSHLLQMNPGLANRALRPGDLLYVPGMVPPAELPSWAGSTAPGTTGAGMPPGSPGVGMPPGSPGVGMPPGSPGAGMPPGSPGVGMPPEAASFTGQGTAGVGSTPEAGYTPGQSYTPGAGYSPSAGYTLGQSYPSTQAPAPYDVGAATPGMPGTGQTSLAPPEWTDPYGPHEHHPFRTDADVSVNDVWGESSSWDVQDGTFGNGWRSADEEDVWPKRQFKWPDAGAGEISVYLGEPDEGPTDMGH